MAHFDGIHRRYIALEKEIKFFNKIPGVLLWGFFWPLKFSGKKKDPSQEGSRKAHCLSLRLLVGVNMVLLCVQFTLMRDLIRVAKNCK